MVAPALLLILALIYAYGRVAQVNGMMESGTRDAARSVTMSRSYDDAKQRAKQVVREALSRGPGSCLDALTVTVSPNFAPDEPITVRATCRYDVSDIGLPGLGSLRSESTFTSMTDPNRGVD